MFMKEIVLRALQRTGAFGVVARSRWRARRLLILCYHGVAQSDEHEWNPHLYVSPTRLRARLSRLQEMQCHVLPLRHALERLRHGTLPPRAVALTFDDGTTDFARLAVPLLREFGMPATVYLTTYYSDHPYPVFDTAISYVVWKGRNSGGNLRSILGGTAALGIRTAEDRRAAINAVRAHAKQRGLPGHEKDALLRAVAGALAVDYDACFANGAFRILPREAIRALPHDLIRVSLHTHRHRTPRNRQLFTREVTENAAALRSALGEAAEANEFCYPSGDYWGEFPAWLTALGIESATTCVPGLASPRTNPLLLPRFLDDSLISDAAFDSWVSGLAEVLPRRRELYFDPHRLRVPSYAEGIGSRADISASPS
ncbi:MAG: hypothetical protein NVS4B3_15910 [Gemmatimonadaceae bacterium]